MSFLANLLGGEKRSGVSDYSSLAKPNNWLSSWFRGGFGDNPSGKDVTPQTAMTIAAVYRGLDLRANTKGMLPLNLYKSRKKGIGADIATDDPLQDLLHNAFNKDMTAFVAQHALSLHRDLRGAAYIGITRDGNLKATGLYPIAPERVVRFVISLDGQRAFYIIPVGGGAEVFVPELFMCMIPGGMSWDGLCGVSILRYAESSLGSMLGMEEHMAVQWKNGARLSGVLKTPNTLDQPSFDRLKKDFLDMYTGSGNAFKTAILEEGLDFEKISLTPEELQMAEAKQLTIPDVSRWLNVPPPLLYHTEGMNFNSLEQLGIMWLQYGMLPELVCYEQQFNKDILTAADRKKGYYIKFNHDALQRGDTRTRIFMYTSGLQWGFLNRDEVREMEDRNPLPNDLGQQYLTPLNMVPLVKNPDLNSPDGQTTPAEGQPGAPGKSKNPADNPPQKDQKAAIKAAFLPIFEQKLSQLATKQMKSLAGKQPEAIDAFFTAHEAFVCDQIRPVVNGYMAALGKPSDSFELAAGECAMLHCYRAKLVCQEANGNFVGLNSAEEATKLMRLIEGNDDDV